MTIEEFYQSCNSEIASDIRRLIRLTKRKREIA